MFLRKHKLLLTVLSLLLILALVTACAPKETPIADEPVVDEPVAEETAVEEPTAEAIAVEEPVTLTIWLLGNSGPGVENALPSFQEEYPYIDVDLQVFGWNDLLPKLQTSLLAETGGPDVTEMFSNQMPVFTQSGAFVPINDLVEPYADDFASFAFLDAIDAEGNIYAVVWAVSPNLLFYRSDILDAEGIDPSSLETWDDLIEVGRTVTHDDQYMFLTASQATQPQYFPYFTGMLSQTGGSPFDVSCNIAINNDDAAFKVLQTMEEINLAEISIDVDAWWTPAFEAAVKGGKLATLFSGAFHVSIMEATDPDAAGLWRVQLGPVIPGGAPTGVYTGGGRGLVIPAQSDKQDAAWKFIEYMTTNAQGIQDAWEGGAITPSYLPVYDADYFDAPNAYFGDQAVGRVILDGLKLLDGVEWHSCYIPSGVMANEIVGPELRSLMLNEKNAQDALDTILQEMEEYSP